MEKDGSISKGKPSPLVDFSAGIFAGAAGLVVGQPFDVVKTKYQTPQFAVRYTSTFSALRCILRDEKVPGLFKGVMSPMAGIAFINGVIFTSYASLMDLQLANNHLETPPEPTLGQICLAGAGSGVLGSFIACPTELIKIRQQSAPTHMSPSVLGVVRSILRTEGLSGLYRGLSATALRDLAYGPYFFTYEATCRLIDEAEEELASLSWPELLTAGGLAGVVAWLATFPLDVFKTRMQATTLSRLASPRKAPSLRQRRGRCSQERRLESHVCWTWTYLDQSLPR